MTRQAVPRGVRGSRPELGRSGTCHESAVDGGILIIGTTRVSARTLTPGPQLIDNTQDDLAVLAAGGTARKRPPGLGQREDRIDLGPQIPAVDQPSQLQ
jgi:hypothetical protein